MKRILSTLLILALAITMSVVSSFADEATDFGIEETISDIIDAKLKSEKVSTLQELVDEVFTKSPASGEEWYILAFRNYTDQINYDAYRKAIDEFANNNEIRNIVTRQRTALACKTLNMDVKRFQNIVDETTGKMGLMSYVFGFHLLHNGYTSTEHTEESIINELLSRQLSDGGWAISGDVSDIDATAMALQAIANFDNKEITYESINRALELLSKRQLDDACYISYGIKNPESSAQVILALSSLGIDALSDTRFIKNGITLKDTFEKFKLEDNTYCHKEGSKSNEMASVEVLYSLCGYKRMLESKTNFYDFDELIEPAIDSTSHNNSKFNLKTILYVVIAVITVIAMLVLLLKGDKKAKSYISILMVAAIAFAAVSIIKIESKEKFYNDKNAQDDLITTTLSIRCDTAIGKSDYIPKDGIILDNVSIKIPKGSSAYDQILTAAKEYRLQLESQSASGYIEGISNIYEFDYGDLSGWMFRIHDNWASVGSNEMILNENDHVDWLYTLDLGKDIGNDYSNTK